MIPWDRLDRAFGGVFRPVGRAAKPTRLMVGLHYLKQIQDLSDEGGVERWVENPYWPYFRGFEFFQHEPPIDPSMMTRWRKRIGGPGIMEEVLGRRSRRRDTGILRVRLQDRYRRDQPRGTGAVVPAA